jgi:N-acetylglucosaminyldiphosphoundecaprenol N-acetyl-beta-D-mannosaminyltransferase
VSLLESKYLEIFEIIIHAGQRSCLIEKVVQKLDQRKTTAILYSNVHVLNEIFTNPELKKLFKDEDLIINDSAALVWLGKLKGLKLYRHTISDLKKELLSQLINRGESLYFLGNTEEVLENLKKTLISEYPTINIKGMHHGFFDFNSEEEESIIRSIKALNPSVVFVGMGVPRQEMWFINNKHRFDGVTFIMGGNCFSYWSNSIARAPLWMQKYALEWLFRLIQEPKRLFKRYIWGNPVFLFRYFKYELSQK